MPEKKNGFRNWQIEPSTFDTNLEGCAPQPSQLAVVPKVFVALLVDK